MGIKIEKAISNALAIANNNAHGYDQQFRWGNDFDCSSLLIEVWEKAGVPVKTRGATYTGNLKSIFIACGFKDVTASVNFATGAGIQKGDVIGRPGHVEMCTAPGYLVGAHINEKGTIVGGKTGDQTGDEISVRKYSNNRWTYVLRYMNDEEAPAQTTPSTGTGTGTSTSKIVGTAVAKTSMNVRNNSNSSSSSKIVDYVDKGETVEVLEVLTNGWYKIVCPKTSCRYAYVSNAGNRYFTYTAKVVAPAPKPEGSTPTAKPATPANKVVAGKQIALNNVKCYTSETTGSHYSTKTGTFYLWDAVVRNGRIRITNRPDRVGVKGQVTCWINIADVGLTV